MRGGGGRQGGQISPRKEETDRKKGSKRRREGERGRGRGNEREGERGDKGQKRLEKTAPEFDVRVLPT